MNTKDKIKQETLDLYDEGADLAVKFQKENKDINFPFAYQAWYSKALRVVHFLAPERLTEFRSYYEIDPKRKSLGYGTFVIQDYLKGVAPKGYDYQSFNSKEQALVRFFNQLTIFNSLLSLIDSKLTNLDTELLAEIQESELNVARKLLKINIRAAGALAGVVVEHHLQKAVAHHNIPMSKKNPTISDLNDPLKNAGVIDTPTWRKISYLADIRNLCSHKKDSDPTKEQVTELIDGADWLVKNIT